MISMFLVETFINNMIQKSRRFALYWATATLNIKHLNDKL